MPLPSQLALQFPNPLPETPAEHSRNLLATRDWGERLPFIGRRANYLIRPPVAGLTPNSLSTAFINGFPNTYVAVGGVWTDLYAEATATTYSYCSTLASNGSPSAALLRFPYTKTLSWTEIQIGLDMGGYAGATNCVVAAIWVLKRDQIDLAEYPLPTTNAPYLLDDGQFLAGYMYLNFPTGLPAAIQHLAFPHWTTQIPPHAAGDWSIELRLGTRNPSGAAAGFSIQEFSPIQVTIDEVIPAGARYTKDLLQVL